MRSLLTNQPDLSVVGEASDGLEAIKLVETLKPDIVLMDVVMTNLNGIDAGQQIHQRGLKTRVIFLSMHANPAYVVRALQNGALGYVLKDADFHEILQAIHNAMEGKRYLSEAITNDVLELLLNLDAGKSEPPSTLTGREKEVLQLVAEGNTNNVIGEKLGISARTVEAHRASIMAKLHLTSQAALVRYAIQHGLIPLE
jgi:two-component system, NarL family, response regulator NreC